jgi:polyisoprenoid-binding protein YceI
MKQPTKTSLWTLICLSCAFLALSSQALGAERRYKIDTKGMHAFIVFKIKHLGFSWLEGHIGRFDGQFVFDEEKPANNRVQVTMDMRSLDTRHAERDKHLKGADFFDVEKYPQARFVSTAWEDLGNGKARLKGTLSLRGVEKDVVLDVTHLGGGKDPWGGFRQGFEATTTLKLSDFNMKKAAMLGPAAEEIRIWVSLEGIWQPNK